MTGRPLLTCPICGAHECGCDDDVAVGRFVKGATPVTLIGTDGNAFSVLARCGRAGEQAGWTDEDRDQFMAAATADDYNRLLATCLEWFDVR